MKNRQGAKKLYKAHKTWIAAGLAAATLFSVQALGTQTVAADTDTAPITETDAKTELLNVIAKNKTDLQSIGNVQDKVTGRSFFGDLDALSAEVQAGKYTTKEQLYDAMKPMMQGYKEYLKDSLKSKVAAVGNDTYGETGRTFYGEIDALINSSTVSADDTGVKADVDTDALQAVLAAAEAANTKTINIDLVDTTSNVVVKQLSYETTKNGGIDLAQVENDLPSGYRIDKTKGHQDPKTGKYYVGVYNVADVEAKAKDAANQIADAAKAATKTINVDFIDTTSNEVVQQSSFIVGKNSGVSLEKAATALTDTTYKIDATQEGRDPKTGKYYVGVYNTKDPQAVETAAKNAVDAIARGIKDATKTIKIDYIDINTNEVVKQTSFVVPKGGHLSIEEGTSKAPEGYVIDWAQIQYRKDTGKYYIGVFKPTSIADTPNMSTLASEKARRDAESQKPTPKQVSTKAAATTSAKKATKTLPKTGDRTNTVASSIGVVAVIGALFGLAGTTKKRA
ncbi:KxYKxGKxW signal peptide domain-containing protein [Lacticaseibacillus suibinensis]|uniref:KxYKxGKxW signal peptide domain-containing protein n=1 Tax=Lacticaseibacillus suibinensis TaxID=2486011 RepID=UPI000F76E0C0|nr:KxYKxGKxW signal peptide domain-containing protein [Lacticaseibacillus suibinensis]